MSNVSKEKIQLASQLREGEMIDIFYFGKKIKNNCLVVKVVQDHFFKEGLVVYLNGVVRETIDLENQDGLSIQKSLKYLLKTEKASVITDSALLTNSGVTPP